MSDATATVQDDAMLEGGSNADVPGAAVCHVPESVAALPMPGCAVALPPYNSGCGASEFAVGCGESVSFTPPEECFDPYPFCNGGPGYCCPCLGADAGAACVNIDPSSYDRSCRSDSDCVLMTSGSICAPRGCLCPNAAINVNDWNGYWQAVSALPQSPAPCRCGDSFDSPRAVCSHGVCTVD